MKTHVIFLLLGALLGAALASIVVPPTLSWYATPGGMPKGAQVQVVVQMPEVIHYATSKLIAGQAISFSLFLASKRRKEPAVV